MKILFTGFKPFLEDLINPTEEIVKYLKSEFQNPNLDIQIYYLILPVSFKDSPAMVLEFVKKNNFQHTDWIIMNGLAKGRKTIDFEKVALNWVQSSNPDENGFKPESNWIMTDKDKAYFSDFDLNQWKEHLNKELKSKSLCQSNIEFGTSFYAGTFVCNYIYYFVSQNDPLNMKKVFIHWPASDEMISVKKKSSLPNIHIHGQLVTSVPSYPQSDLNILSELILKEVNQLRA